MTVEGAVLRDRQVEDVSSNWLGVRLLATLGQLRADIDAGRLAVSC